MPKKIQRWLSKLLFFALIFQITGTSLFLSIPKVQAAEVGDIVINEISPHTSPEWVELKNISTQIIDLNNWTIEDNASHVFKTLNSTLDPNARIVISNSSAILNNDDDSVILKDNSALIIDQKDYTSFSTSGSPAGANISLSRIPDGAVGWLKTRSTEGVTNNADLPTPTLQNPGNNALTNINDINFSWDAIVDPEGDDVAYDLYYKKDGQLTGILINSTSSPKMITDLEDGIYTWNITVRDSKGAQTQSLSFTFTIDTIAPVAIQPSDLSGSATSSGGVTLNWETYTADIGDSYNIITPFETITGLDSKQWTSSDNYLTSDGKFNFQVGVVDSAGNVSPYITIPLKKSGNSVYFEENILPPGSSPEVIPVAGNLKVGVITDNSYYGIVTKPEVPAHLLPDELKKKTVGSYWTFEYYGDNDIDNDGIADGGIIQIYFTQGELDIAHITNPETQLKLYYYNETEASWKEYGTWQYQTPSDMAGFAGYLRAEVTHFTEFVAVADKFVPLAPSGVKVTHYDSKLKISWDRVEGATGYRVHIGTSLTNWVKEIEVVGENNTQIEETIQSGKTYFVKIFAIGYDSLLSPASEIISLAIAGVEPQVVFATVEPTEEIVPSPVVSESILQPPIEPPISSTPTLEEEKSDEEESSTNRIVISIIILILAAGAGIGGYYGYLWWQDRNQPEEKAPVSPAKKTTPVKSKTKKSASTKRRSSRW